MVASPQSLKGPEGRFGDRINGEIISEFKYSSFKYSFKWLKLKSVLEYTQGMQISVSLFLLLALKWHCRRCCSGLPQSSSGRLFPYLLSVLAAAGI